MVGGSSPSGPTRFSRQTSSARRCRRAAPQPWGVGGPHPNTAVSAGRAPALQCRRAAPLPGGRFGGRRGIDPETEPGNPVWSRPGASAWGGGLRQRPGSRAWVKGLGQGPGGGLGGLGRPDVPRRLATGAPDAAVRHAGRTSCGGGRALWRSRRWRKGARGGWPGAGRCGKKVGAAARKKPRFQRGRSRAPRQQKPAHPTNIARRRSLIRSPPGFFAASGSPPWPHSEATAAVQQNQCCGGGNSRPGHSVAGPMQPQGQCSRRADAAAGPMQPAQITARRPETVAVAAISASARARSRAISARACVSGRLAGSSAAISARARSRAASQPPLRPDLS